MSPNPSNLRVALEWAAAGVAVFPCQPVDTADRKAKSPLVKWQHSASTDPDTIRSWWHRWPEALPGLRTDKLIVVDCDRHGEADGVAAFSQLGLPLDDAMRVRTPSGGEHYYWGLSEPVHIGNRTGALPDGIDVRSEGRGYVIAEGAELPDGRRYERISGPAPRREGRSESLAAVPPDLLKILGRQCEVSDRPSQFIRRQVSSNEAHRATAENDRSDLDALDLTNVALFDIEDSHLAEQRLRGGGFLDCLHRELASVPEGRRGSSLNKIAYRAGRFVGGGDVVFADACRALFLACHVNGLVAKDGADIVRGNLERALRDGMSEPARLPDRRSDSGGRPGHGPLSGASSSPWIIFGHAPPEPQQWLIKNMVPRRGVVQLVGASGCGKSAVALWIAAHVIEGEAFYEAKVVRPGAVLWLAAEGGDEVIPRLEALHSMGILRRPAPFAHLIDVPRLLDSQAEEKVLQLVQQGSDDLRAEFDVDVSLIVIDTSAAAAGHDNENDNAEAQRLFNLLQKVAREFDCAVLVIDHFGKNGSDRGTRGASAKDAAADARFALAMNHGVGQIDLVKLRGGATRMIGHYKLEPVVLGHDGDGEAVTAVIASATDAGGKVKRMRVGDQRIKNAFDRVVASGHTVSHKNLMAAYNDLGYNGEMYFRRDFKAAKKAGIVPPLDADGFELCDAA